MKKVFLGLYVVCMSSFFLSGCGGDKDKQTPPPAPMNESNHPNNIDDDYVTSAPEKSNS